MADDPDKTFERLYERYVVRYDLGTGKRRTERRKTDEDIWRTVRDKLKKCGLTIPFQPKEVVGDQDQHSFIDLAAARSRIEARKIHYNTIRLAFPRFLSQPQRRIAFHPFLTLDLDLNRASDMFQTAGKL